MSRAPDPESATKVRRRQPGLHRASARDGHGQHRPRARQTRPEFLASTARGAVSSEAGPLGRITGTLLRPGLARTVARTAGFTVTATVAAGLGGIVIARAVGPTVRGEYAAVTAWFGVAVLLGGMGQPAALCFHVARDPLRAREYTATSRAMMIATGALAVAAGVLLAPVLARGNTGIALAYRIAFGASIITLVGASYAYSLQARDLSRWNVSRTVQPLLSLIAILVLWRLRLLNLDVAVVVLASTMLAQLGWAYWSCRRVDLVPGHARADLLRPLATYGALQIAGFAPAALNQQLDQLVLSQTVPPADLGRYAIAASLTLLPLSAVSAIGFVALPRLASEREVTAAGRRLQRTALLSSAALTVAMLLPLAVGAPWLVPLVFGAAYRGAVPLIWILTPGAICLICGQVVVDLLLGRGHPGVVAWAQGLAALFTMTLLFALLPFLGVYAAAIASTVSYGGALAVMLHRLLHLPAHARGSAPKTPNSSGLLVPDCKQDPVSRSSNDN